MTLELVDKIVDGRTYAFEQLNTTTALKVLAKLTKIIGEPLMIGLGSLPKKEQPRPLTAAGVPAPLPEPVKKKSLGDFDLTELKTDVLGRAVAALTDRLDETEVVALVRQLTSEKVLCDNAPVVFDSHFRGQTAHLFKVLMAALEAQYGDFLGAVTAKAAPVGGPVSLRR